MRIAVDISFYPLDASYVTPIKEFIRRLNAHPDLQVSTNAFSTHVAGEHARVFELLSAETATSFAGGGRAVFVMKVLGGEPASDEA